MAEWSKARDSKSRNPQKGFEGSNPSLSAMYQSPLGAPVHGKPHHFNKRGIPALVTDRDIPIRIDELVEFHDG